MGPGFRRDDGGVAVREKEPCVYIMASGQRGTLYVGITSNLLKRVWEHKNNVVGGFTNDYHVHRLVWFERHDSMYAAIVREKAIKEWQRLWKIELIEKSNPAWRDLYPELV